MDAKNAKSLNLTDKEMEDLLINVPLPKKGKCCICEIKLRPEPCSMIPTTKVIAHTLCLKDWFKASTVCPEKNTQLTREILKKSKQDFYLKDNQEIGESSALNVAKKPVNMNQSQSRSDLQTAERPTFKNKVNSRSERRKFTNQARLGQRQNQF